MKRRDFSSHLLATAAGAATWSAATASHAQAAAPVAMVEGTHYVKLGQPLPTPASDKIEVLEFFWYGCPHCFSFEPMLNVWVRNLPADVAFRRVPIAFRDEPFTTHQRIYFALESMGALESMHRKVFNAIHIDKQHLDKLPEIVALVTKNGVDGAKFTESFNSFSVQTKARQAKKLAEAYRIDGVPALGIQGKFYTSGTLAGTPERSLEVADYLLQRVRKNV
jgi:protein dithiol oxidoreductase (disulfide-forming)